MMSSSLSAELSKRTSFFGLKLWVIIGVTVGAFIVVILFVMSLCLGSWRKSRKYLDKLPVTQIPAVSKEIKEVKVDGKGSFDNQKWSNFKAFVFEGSKKYETNPEKGKGSSQSESEIGINGSSGNTPSVSLYNSSYAFDGGSPLCGMPQVSSLGWGYWFTLRDLEIATNYFTKENVVGEGGYGIVYRGILSNGSVVAVKNLFNNLGQAEKEFKVEVEAIGRVRHKNLVRLLGYCVEGTHRILVYEYVDNGNLEQWLHEPMNRAGVLSWEARMRIVFGTAKALAYLHEALEPKVVHRDIKSSNILIDHDFNAKVSDFGLAKLLGSGKSHVTTRVMGTFGYVAPEYANTGLLNERSDVYSFGVLLLEAITGREPIDYRRPPGEVNLVDWLKTMVGSRRCEDVLDPSLETKPPTRELKKALLVALRCVDPDSERRPKMGQVVHMHEADAIQTFMPKNRRSKSSRTTVTETVNKERPTRKLTKQSKGSSIGCSRSQK